MFQPGDLILYGGTGVCRVTGITVLPPSNGQYYVMTPVFAAITETIYVSVKSKAPMRPLLSPSAARACLEEFAALPAETAAHRDPRQTAAHYQDILKSGDCRKGLSLLKGLYMKSAAEAHTGRRTSQTDQRFIKEAEYLVLGELAAVLGQSPEEIRESLKNAISISV